MNQDLLTSWTNLTPLEYQALLRQDFASFVHRCFLQLSPQGTYLHNWHLDLLAHHLEACRRGEKRRLIINVPPRSLKSLCASVALPAFWLGHDPSAQILCASYGQDLAEKLSLDCRQIVTSDWYQALFPTRLSRTRNAAQEFTTTRNGTRMATSVGGVLTGRGADLIIIDDPLKPDEAASESQRTKVNDWFDGTLFTRLNDKEKGCIIVIMQRLHSDDLVGHLVEKGGWELLSLPAIADEEEVFEYATLLGPQIHRRQPGDLLHPERESLDTLMDIKRNLGENAFAGQYLQAPFPAGGAMVKESWLLAYEPGELPKYFDHVVLSVDTANKVTELSDYTAFTVWGYKRPKIYLLDVVRKKLTYPELKAEMTRIRDRWHPTATLVEDKASGTQLIQDLQHEGNFWVRPVKPEGDKVMRMNAQTLPFEQGQVFLPTQAPWLAEYRAELLSFPLAKHDDQVDSTSQALKWIREKASPGGVFEYYRQLAIEIQGEAYVLAKEEESRRRTAEQGR